MNEQPENLKFDYVSDLLKFDYMNPDFKTKNNNGSMYFLNTPEQKFFFAHKIIDCLNKINESNNSFFNFETVTVDDTALRGHECFTVNLKMPVVLAQSILIIMQTVNLWVLMSFFKKTYT